MKIKTLTGHLTATEKRIVRHLIENDMPAGKSARITVAIFHEGVNEYRVISSRKELDMWDRETVRKTTSTIQVTK